MSSVSAQAGRSRSTGGSWRVLPSGKIMEVLGLAAGVVGMVGVARGTNGEGSTVRRNV